MDIFRTISESTDPCFNQTNVFFFLIGSKSSLQIARSTKKIVPFLMGMFEMAPPEDDTIYPP